MKLPYINTIFFVLLIISILIYLIIPPIFSNEILILVLVCTAIVVLKFTFFVQKDKNQNKSYFKLVYLVLLGYLIVHFQYYIDLVLGNINLSNFYIFPSTTSINKSSIISFCGLLAFMIGYISTRKKIKKIKKYEYKIYPLFLLNIINLTFVISFITNVGYEYINGGYGKIDLEGSISAYLSIISELSFFAIFIITIKNKSLNDNNKTLSQFLRSFSLIFYISLLLYFSIILLSGDRGPLIRFTIAFFLSYIIFSQKQIKFITLILLLSVSAFVVTILGIARSFSVQTTLGFSDKITLALNQDKVYNSMSFSPSTVELAGSVRCLHRGIEYIPENHPFTYGLFLIKNILSIVPFSNNITSIIFDNSYKYKSSAAFITWINQGDHPTSGDGTTCITDLYLDFGIIGVVFGMFLFGLIIKRIDISIYNKDIANYSYLHLSLIYIFFAASLYFARSSIALEFRSVVWLYFIIVFYTKITKHYAK